jgi:hypothetical protein
VRTCDSGGIADTTRDLTRALGAARAGFNVRGARGFLR